MIESVNVLYPGGFCIRAIPAETAGNGKENV